MQFLWAAGYLVLLGILSHFIGNALPRDRFDPKAFPYRECGWEKGLYARLKISVWKDRLPDMSRYCSDMRRKTVTPAMNAEEIKALVQETCVAECVHWGLILLSPGVLLLCSGWPGQILFWADILLLNLPFILIQRYNRPKLMVLQTKLELRAARRKETRS